ncbi:MAG TPA: DUF5689 domain-containing protein [Flavobacteriales bacterium]
MKNIGLGTIATILILQLTLVSCEREYDRPPIDEIPVGGVIDLATLRGMYTGTPIKFTEDKSVYAIVTADEVSGNLYKEAYIQDATGAIKLRLLSSGGLYEGDSVRVALKGTTLTVFNGLLQLDSVDVDKNVIKQAVGRHFQPTTIPLNEITIAHQSQLVRIENVEFVGSELNTTWANANALAAVNHNITDCNGNTRILRTSGYANFAGQTIPSGNGSLIAIVGVFNSDLQLYIRKPSEVQFNNPRCTPPLTFECGTETSLTETFASHSVNGIVNEYCWSSYATVGTLNWLIKDLSGNRVAEASIAGTGDSSNEMWMVSPKMQATDQDILSFDSACQGWNHDGLTVWVSKNFDGNIGAASWTQLNCNIAGNGTANNTFVGSGNIQLHEVLGAGYNGTYHVAFKYNASGPGQQTTSFKVDNVQITH